MLIFDEKKYAKNLLKKKEFQTYRQKDIERYILIRYLANEGMSTEEIRKELDKFPLVGCEYLDKKDVDMIYDKIIDRALSYPLVTGIHSMIFKTKKPTTWFFGGKVNMSCQITVAIIITIDDIWCWRT